MLVRVKGDARTMLPLLRQEIVAVDPNVAISEALPLSRLIENMQRCRWPCVSSGAQVVWVCC